MNITFVRLLDVCYLATLYLYIGLIFSSIINELFGHYNYDQINSMTTLHIILSITFQFWLIALSAYLIRNIVSIIPNPFENVLGYYRSQEIIPEINGGVIISFILLLIQSTLKDNLFVLHKRIKFL